MIRKSFCRYLAHKKKSPKNLLRGGWLEWLKSINWLHVIIVFVLIIAATTGIVWYVKRHKKKDVFDENEI